MTELLWWHRVGVKVVVIGDSCIVEGTHAEGNVSKGEYFEIASVIQRDGRVFFTLKEKLQHWEYGSRLFRPVREISIDCFRSLLVSPEAKAGKRVSETEEA